MPREKKVDEPNFSSKQRVHKDYICVPFHFDLLIDVVAVTAAFISTLLRATL